MSTMTEAEARGKWCPMARVAALDEATGSFMHAANRNLRPSEAEESCCCASGCLGWRWWDGLSDDGTACHHTPTRMAPRVPETPEGRPLAERRGYCGLAGSIRP